MVCALALWPIALCAAPGSVPEKLLTPAEITAIDRENDMWRLVQADEEVARNLEILREAGFAADDIKRMEPRLTELWTIPFERHFGWLTAETVEQIQEIDRTYIARMRAARVRMAVGIQIMAPYESTPRQVSAQWHWAVLKALEYDELAEFRLMNSPSARQVDVWTKGMALTESERRQLNEWQRDYDAVYGRDAARGTWSGAENNRWRQEARLEQLGRVRDLLGDERCGAYLEAMNPAFHRMGERLGEAGASGPTTALNVWWIRQKYQLARAGENRRTELDALATAERDELTTLLGPETFARYTADADERRWLYPQRAVVQRGSPAVMKYKPVGIPPRTP